MALEFRGVTKQFATNAGSGLTAIRDVTFKVDEGEFVSVVGPSGCGKSTLLSMTAGLFQPTTGEVPVSDHPVRGPNDHVGFMLQKDLLLPWRNIVGNVEFGLEARGVAAGPRRERAMAELKRCHLAGFENHYPYQLSGGMRQRAALARTLAIDPEIILLDEPFSALDAQTKLLLQDSFAATIAESGKTTLLVTHDLSEAVLMSDRILVLSERPGTVIAEIRVDLPHRAHPLKRRVMPEVGEYAGQIFRHLPLSLGEVHEGNIGCRYHGVIVNGEGVVVRVPAMPECALEGRKALKSFETTEANDAVFVYFPSVEQPEAPQLVLPKELVSNAWTGFLCTSVWETNYRYALDNLADPMHGCYLHSESFTLAYGSKQDLMKLDKTEHGFHISRVGQVGENFDWAEFEIHPGDMFCFLDIPYPPAAGPGGFMRIVGFTLPVDERTCKVFFWRMREVSGLARESWRFLYRAKLEENHWNVLEQDRVILEGMPDDARKREMLYQHDLGVSRIRQILTRAAKSQVEAELAQAQAAE